MKIALVHDYIKEYGGAERVLEALHEVFPDAPVYTSVYLPEFLGQHRERFSGWDIKTSIVQYLPFKEKLISPLRIISPLLFRSFDLSKFDVVIVSATGAYFPNTIKCHPEFISGSKIQQAEKKMLKQVQHDRGKKTVHVCYCHTPPRYLYGYMTARDWKKNLAIRVFGEIANHFLRLVDFRSAQNVDYFIANSEEVASRIEKFYRRDSTLIYPPVDVEKSKIKNQKSKPQIKIQNFRDDKEYYLTGGRLARAKGIDVIIDAFVKSGKPLKIFGKGFGGYNYSSSAVNVGERSREVDSRQARTVSNIEYLGEAADEEKFELMRNAKAFIFASYDEDFGITPVEAMSVGAPVIAYRSGGVQETVVEDKTGVFYDKNTPEELIKAIQKFEKMTFDPKDCINQAKKFSKERFVKQIELFINSKIKSI